MTVKSDDSPRGLVRAFTGKTQPYQDFVDRFKANVASDIRSFYKVVLLSRKQNRDMHSEYADCFSRMRETNARELPQEPLADWDLYTTLCCYSRVDPFYKEFEKIGEDIRIDHNTMDGKDRVERMILLDNGAYILAFAAWLNDGEKWKETGSDGKPVLHWFFREDNQGILDFLEREKIGPQDWPTGIALHERINAALKATSQPTNEDQHHDERIRPDGPPVLKMV